MKRIYLDYSASTPVLPEVWEFASGYCLNEYGNPSSLHDFGFQAKKAIEKTRKTVARFIAAPSAESILFTGSGTEANNIAIQGIVSNIASKPVHIITAATEHSSVDNVCHFLERQGHEVTFLPVDSTGIVALETVEKNIRTNTVLISIHWANSETGVIQPVRDIGDIALRHNVVFHSDAVQAIGKIPVDVTDAKISLLSSSSHKFYSLKGAGFLYADFADIRLRLMKRGFKTVSDDLVLMPLMYGGYQEMGLRPATENVPAIAAMGKALEIAETDMASESSRQTGLRDYFIDTVLDRIPGTRLNGSRKSRLPNNCNFCFRGVRAYELMLLLDRKGIACSSGSACSSHAEKPSRVLAAMGLSPEEAAGSLRFTLGRYTTKQDIDLAAGEIEGCVGKLLS